MAEVISPPVHVLDYGYTSPNSVDFMRAGSQMAAPITEAVQQGNAQRNQFLLNQINNQKAMELARQQHVMQIQREQMRDARMMEVAKMRSQSVLDAVKAKQGLGMVATSLDTLINRY